MTDPSRGVRSRRNHRRPGPFLLSALLVLAIVASSALVFTNRVELLKLAVIVALWAAVIAAFISFLYRRQADIDQARARDLKLVYDLQLDREISARREYELSVESHLRRELAAELRTQSSDEVASLRAELAALRANLEILFDTDLAHRPAIENERTAVHTFGRVISSRLDAESRDEDEPHTDESPIIDVPAEPHIPEAEWSPESSLEPEEGGAHRRASERGRRRAADAGTGPSTPSAEVRTSRDSGWRPVDPPPPARTPDPAPEPAVRYPWLPPEPPPAPVPSVPSVPSAPVPPLATPSVATAPPVSTPPPPPPPVPTPAPPVVTPPPVVTSPPPPPTATPNPATPEPVGRHTTEGSDSRWRPAPAEGQFIPAGHPGSNWQSPPLRNGAAPAPATEAEQPATPPHMAAEPSVVPPAPPAPTPEPAASPPPAMTPPPTEERRGRHWSPPETDSDEDRARRARHSAVNAADPGRPSGAPSVPPASPSEPRSARHRGADDEPADSGQHAGGQGLSDLFARLQVAPSEGGRRRRRDD